MLNREMRDFNRLCLILALLALRSAGLSSQAHNAVTSFQSPVDYPITLAGNFGEPRPHHFHGGLDIKTDGREGKHIYAIGDGYVSRVTMGLYGFGNAVYVTHPEGVTSVYCHLKAFSPRIKAALRRYQYRHQTSVADARLSPMDVPVSQGQLIALSGNTGNSTAPHLHLEIHDTRTWHMLDPYAFLAHAINDTVAPMAHGLMVLPQEGRGVFNGSSRRQTFGIGTHTIDRSFTAWGEVGFALWANDYMQGSYNHYGVRRTTLTVDGREVFSATVDSIPMALNRMVNAWGDYSHWLHYRTWYLKSFAEPGCKLPIIHTDARRGLVVFDEQRDYHLVYQLQDFKGNTSHYSFTVRGVPDSIPPAQRHGAHLMSCRKTSTFSLPGMQLVVPYGMLAADVWLQPIASHREGEWSRRYSFTQESCPLVGDAEISIAIDGWHKDVAVETTDSSKFYLTCDGRYAGGAYHQGWVSGRIRDLGATCMIAYDDEPPKVRPLSLSCGRLLLAVNDDKSGVASWRATIDGRFVVFDAVEKTHSLVCRLDEAPIRPSGKNHRLQLLVTDHCHNTTAYETDVTY